MTNHPSFSSQQQQQQQQQQQLCDHQGTAAATSSSFAFASHPNPNLLAQRWNNHGAYLLEQKRYGDSIQYLVRALKISQRLNQHPTTNVTSTTSSYSSSSSQSSSSCGCNFSSCRCCLEERITDTNRNPPPQQQEESTTFEDSIDVDHSSSPILCSSSSSSSPMDTTTTTTTTSTSSSSSSSVDSTVTSTTTAAAAAAAGTAGTTSNPPPLQEQDVLCTGGYLYTKPTYVSIEQQEGGGVGHDMGGSVTTLTIMIIFNLALAYHLSALSSMSVYLEQQDRPEKMVLHFEKARKLYEVAYHLQLELPQQPQQQQQNPFAGHCSYNPVQSMKFMMIVTNNLSEVHRTLNDEIKHTRCLELLLSTIMFAIDRRRTRRTRTRIQRHQNDGSSSDHHGSVLSESYKELLERFMRNITSSPHLAFRSTKCANAA